MKETATDEEQIALKIVTKDSNIATNTIRNDADNGKKNSCITIISFAWWLVCMSVNVLTLFIFPALNSYSFRDEEFGEQLAIVFSFDKWWLYEEIDENRGLAEPYESKMYALVCDDNYYLEYYSDLMSNSADDFCVLKKNGALYFWSLITSIILQFIVVIINCKCGHCYFFNSICNNQRINYLLACAIGFISVFLTVVGYLCWKWNSIDTIENITKDCVFCGYGCRRRLQSEDENMHIMVNNTYYGHGYNYNISNISSTVAIGYSTTYAEFPMPYECDTPCNGSIKDEFANIAVLVFICVNLVMFLFLAWCTK